MTGSVAAHIQFATVISLDRRDAPPEPGLNAAFAAARSYLLGFPWVAGIERSYLGNTFDGIVSIFLFQIAPNSPDVDDYVWVLVGDLPPADITVEDSPNPRSALDAYIGAMAAWVAAVEDGQPIDDLIPVDAAPSPENARDLQTRLAFLEREILPLCQGNLAPHRPV